MARRAKELLRIALVAAAAVLLALGIARTSGHRALEDAYYDWWHVIAGVRYGPRHTAVVAIDDETLLALKDDPLAFWAPQFGKAIEVLTQAGAKTIGLDFLYLVSAEGWLRKLNLQDSDISRSYDAPLRAALSNGNVVLITHLVTLKEGADLLTPPADQLVMLPRGIHDLGVANLFPDEDKHIRHFLASVDPDPQRPGLGFAMQLGLRAAGKDPTQSEWEIAGARVTREPRTLAIGYTGPPGTIPVVSMITLLKPDAMRDPAVRSLKDKVVVIAANNAGTSDRHFTPYARGASAELMNGGEIHANIVETILQGRYPRALPQALEIAYLAALLALAAWGFMRLSVPKGVGLALGVCAAVALPSYLLLQYDWIVPVAEPQAGILMAFLMSLGLRLTGEERERARIREMFGKYVSDEVVDKLLEEERRPDLGGEALNVTVLFSDIRGFTTISERLSAREVVEMLNAYFTRVCEPILAQGGTVDKFIGDAVMAVFGSPVRHPDHARRAIRAALGMAREAEGFKQWMRERFPDRGLSEFGVGVGLHSGEAVIGDIGTPKRKDFTAIGDTVNAASRLEGVTKEMGCVIVASEATVKAAGAGLRTGKFENKPVKGKAEPMPVYEILGLDED
ncbi:MAG: adenylate/guanylate cyclase domain-containing protein [Betaproteobacteria bacterium]|nr:adenylate/guanylate cyclase domain-containing protein [Betaproteobacteria bacterium]